MRRARTRLLDLLIVTSILLFAAAAVLSPQVASRRVERRLDRIGAQRFARQSDLLENGIHSLRRRAAIDGQASWYGNRDGFETASGQRFDEDSLTAAMRGRGFLGRRVRVTALDSGKSIVVRVNDYGPHARLSSRVIDLSRAAFKRLAPLHRGLIRVRVELLPRDPRSSRGLVTGARVFLRRPSAVASADRGGKTSRMTFGAREASRG